MKFTSTLLIAIVSTVLLAACGQSEPPPLKHDTVEDSRATSRANALWNAQAYRAENPRFDESFKIVSHGDTSITETCPQGSGWAQVSIMKVENKQIEKYVLQCSTYSGALGCYLDADFVKKPFASMKDTCQAATKVPFPLPKIAK